MSDQNPRIPIQRLHDLFFVSVPIEQTSSTLFSNYKDAGSRALHRQVIGARDTHQPPEGNDTLPHS